MICWNTHSKLKQCQGLKKKRKLPQLHYVSIKIWSFKKLVLTCIKCICSSAFLSWSTTRVHSLCDFIFNCQWLLYFTGALEEITLWFILLLERPATWIGWCNTVGSWKAIKYLNTEVTMCATCYYHVFSGLWIMSSWRYIAQVLSWTWNPKSKPCGS